VSAPAAAWYPDPAGSDAQRWWDGVQWTQQTRALPAPPPPLPPVAQVQPTAFDPNYQPQFSPQPSSQFPSQPMAPQFQPMGGQPPSPYTLAPAYAVTGAASTRLKRTNAIGYAGAVLGLGSLIFNPFTVTSVLAIIFCIIGLAKEEQMRSTGGRPAGRGWMIAGLIISSLSGIYYWFHFVGAIQAAVGAG
jgi:Protein of unknown function (DUF2510)